MSILTVGLTGGLGSGKSTASNQFQNLGVPVIDADQLARTLVSPGSPLLNKIITHFGPCFLDPQGALNRRRLRQVIFSNNQQRKILEQILHPAIYSEMERQRSAIKAPYIIFSVPLLIETGHCKQVDQVLVVDASVDQQYKRVRTRDSLSDPEIYAILKSQCGRKERLAEADQVLYNQGDLASLAHAVKALHQKYLAMTLPRSFTDQ